MTETSTASVRICGECYTEHTVVERAVILVVLLYRNGMVGDDGSIGPFLTAMRNVVIMEDAESATGKTSKKIGLAATLSNSLKKLSLINSGKLLVSDGLHALKYLTKPGVTEVDIRALDLPAELVDKLYHKKDKLHPNGPIFGGQSVVTLGCGHASVTTAPVVEAETSSKGEDVQTTAAESTEVASTVAEEVSLQGQEPSAEEESKALSHDEGSGAEPEGEDEVDIDVRLTTELLQSIKSNQLADTETVEKLIGHAEMLEERVGELEDRLAVEMAGKEKLTRTNTVLREQIGLLRDRLTATLLPKDARARVVRILGRSGNTAETA